MERPWIWGGRSHDFYYELVSSLGPSHANDIYILRVVCGTRRGWRCLEFMPEFQPGPTFR